MMKLYDFLVSNIHCSITNTASGHLVLSLKFEENVQIMSVFFSDHQNKPKLKSLI